MSPPRAATILREIATVLLCVGGVTFLLARAQGFALLRDHLHLAIGALFLFTALHVTERLPGGLSRYGLSLGGVLTPDPTQPREPFARDLARAVRRAAPLLAREALAALAVCAVVFPPFAVGFYLWHSPAHGFVLTPDPDLASFAMTQIVVVGLPEEALFRGYVQGRLHDAFPERTRVLGASLSLRALALQAALFAMLHFAVEPHPARLAVFFPALLFGWLTARRGGIGAAVLVHAASNLLSDTLVRGFL